MTKIRLSGGGEILVSIFGESAPAADRISRLESHRPIRSADGKRGPTRLRSPEIVHPVAAESRARLPGVQHRTGKNGGQ